MFIWLLLLLLLPILKFYSPYSIEPESYKHRIPSSSMTPLLSIQGLKFSFSLTIYFHTLLLSICWYS